MGSSIGAKVLEPGQRFVLYKNRDFATRHLDDRIVYTRRLFAVQGAEADDPEGEVHFEGYSFGVNAAGLACADSRVARRDGAASEDVLVQRVLERCGSVFEAVDFARDEAADRRYSWANLVVADRHGVAAVEVRDSARAYQHPRQINRANHHAGWGAAVPDQEATSRQRHAVARDLLYEVESHTDVMQLCRSHVPNPGDASICRHGDARTAFSYVAEVVGGSVVLFVQQGNPCLGEYTRIPLHFPPDQDELSATLRAYPGAAAMAVTQS